MRIDPEREYAIFSRSAVFPFIAQSTVAFPEATSVYSVRLLHCHTPTTNMSLLQNIQCSLGHLWNKQTKTPASAYGPTLYFLCTMLHFCASWARWYMNCLWLVWTILFILLLRQEFTKWLRSILLQTLSWWSNQYHTALQHGSRDENTILELIWVQAPRWELWYENLR